MFGLGVVFLKLNALTALPKFFNTVILEAQFDNVDTQRILSIK
jgi:hypothetical protein